MLSLERFAEVRAAIERGGNRDVVLRKAGIAPAEWIRGQRRWLDALAAEVATGKDTLASQYCRAFEAARAAPVTASGSAPVIAPVIASASASAPGSAPAPAPPQETPIQVVPQRPSFEVAAASLAAAPVAVPIAAAPAAAPIAAAKPSLGGTMMTLDVPRGPATPFRESAPAPPPAPALPPAEAASRIPTGTAFAFEVPRGPATPFQSEVVKTGGDPPNPAAQPAASATTGQPAAPVHPGSGTAWAPSAPSGPATPFQALSADAMGFTLLRYSELVAARDEAGASLPAVLAEFGLDAASHAKVEAHWQRKFSENGLLALSFGRHLAAAKTARHATKSAAAPVPAATSAPAFAAAAPAGTGTALALDVPRPAPQGSPAAPQPSTSQAPELTVEQYAWLVATLRRAAPADLPATLARFRLTTETRKEIEERWSRRMAADPAVREAFLTALSRRLGGGA